MRRKNLAGSKFGRLFVLRVDENHDPGKVKWICECECGNVVSVRSNKLLAGHTKSCGCIKADRMRAFAAGRIKEKAECSVSECNSPSKARGYCIKHYARFMRNGHVDLTRNENGSGHLGRNGYVEMYFSGRRVYEHVLVAEKALGKKLPKGAVVHHVNMNRSDNRNSNLVICQNEKYHRLLHKRMKELGYV